MSNFGFYLDFEYDRSRLFDAFISVSHLRKPFLNHGYDIIVHPDRSQIPETDYCSELLEEFSQQFLFNFTGCQFIDVSAGHTIPIHQDKSRNFVVIFPISGTQPTLFYDDDDQLLEEIPHRYDAPVLLDAAQPHNTIAGAHRKINFQISVPRKLGKSFKKVQKHFTEHL